MPTTAWSQLEADKAFTHATRARRRAALARKLRRRPADCGCLTVADQRIPPSPSARAGARGKREIPLDAICCTLEPNRAAHFDPGFRPAAPTRSRWQRIWLAEQHGSVLPPIRVVQIGDAYAVRDGHHRVSVARARGALTIDAIVESA
jgi:hypothetical protein